MERADSEGQRSPVFICSKLARYCKNSVNSTNGERRTPGLCSGINISHLTPAPECAVQLSTHLVLSLFEMNLTLSQRAAAGRRSTSMRGSHPRRVADSPLSDFHALILAHASQKAHSGNNLLYLRSRSCLGGGRGQLVG